MKVVKFEDFKAKQRQTLASIFSFLAANLCVRRATKIETLSLTSGR